MPELPEVETFARQLRKELVGQTILQAELLWARALVTPTRLAFKRQIQGQTILGVTRRAKYLILQLNHYNLLIHLRMSGNLLLRPCKIKPVKHDSLTLNLSNGQYLAFNDTRKFGKAWLVEDPQTVLGRLGPEPLEKGFTAEWLYANLQKKKRQLKPLLLDQTFIAGLGNIYTDESLNIAKLHPLTLANAVRPKQAAALRDAIQKVLREGIRRNGASIDWAYRGGQYQNHFRAYDREGQPCQACGATIVKFTVAQRGTHICPRCQTIKRK
ncbi:MAG: DNA-formamidopyrimidine glycosylase [Anaerolineales bacterium]|nr:DNA-formamidopyrimidine glycosylase [Anaerolineales bacterium]